MRSCVSLPVLSSVHTYSFPTCSASCTADFADVSSFLSGALLSEIWLISLSQQGKSSLSQIQFFHFQWELQALCYNSGTSTKPFVYFMVCCCGVQNVCENRGPVEPCICFKNTVLLMSMLLAFRGE